MHSKAIGEEVTEWIACGPGSLAVRTADNPGQIQDVIHAAAREVGLYDGTLVTWHDPEEAERALPNMNPDDHAAVAVVSPGDAQRWAEWLENNHERLGDVDFLLVLGNQADMRSLLLHAPFFTSVAREYGIRPACAENPPRELTEADCIRETGMDYATILRALIQYSGHERSRSP